MSTRAGRKQRDGAHKLAKATEDAHWYQQEIGSTVSVPSWYRAWKPWKKNLSKGLTSK